MEVLILAAAVICGLIVAGILGVWAFQSLVEMASWLTSSPAAMVVTVLVTATVTAWAVNRRHQRHSRRRRSTVRGVWR